MKVTLSKFLGIAPKFDREQVNEGYSVVSRNTRGGRNILEAWRAPVALANGDLGLANKKSIFRYINKWFSFDKANIHAVRVPLVNDPYDYVVIANPYTYPQITNNAIAETGVGPYPAATHRLGVPAPAAPTLISAEPNPDWVPVTDAAPREQWDAYDTSYLLVYVDAWGRASAPSPVSVDVPFAEWEGYPVWRVKLAIPDAPVGTIIQDASRGTRAQYYVYRANFNAGGSSAYQLAGTVSVTGTGLTFTDTKPSLLLDEEVQTYDWFPPPDDNVALFPNGPLKKVFVASSQFLCGCNSKILCFAEPGTTHAWPSEYYRVFREKIVTAHSAGSNVVVLTDSYPYVLSGAHPSSMSPTKLADTAPCLNEAAVTEVFDRIYFASKQGMFEIDGYTLRNVTLDYMTEIEWAEYQPKTMVFSNYDGKVFIHSKAKGETLVFDPAQPLEALRTLDLNPQAVYQLDGEAQLAYVPEGSSQVMLFGEHTTAVQPLQWQSRVYQFNEPQCFSVAKVQANAYPVALKFKYERVDGSEDHYTKLVTNDRFFYLPFQTRGYKWWLEVDSATPVEIRSIQFGTSEQEFD